MVGVMCRAMNLDHPWGRVRNGGGDVQGYEFGLHLATQVLCDFKQIAA